MRHGIPVIPDLLRRFVPTLHSQRLLMGDLCLQLETNDPEIIRAMGQNGAVILSASGDVFLCKLIRDFDVQSSGNEILLVRDQNLDTLWLGATTVFCVDHPRREVLGFIAADVGPAEFGATIVPVLMNLLRNCEQIGSPDSNKDQPFYQQNQSR